MQDPKLPLSSLTRFPPASCRASQGATQICTSSINPLLLLLGPSSFMYTTLSFTLPYSHYLYWLDLWHTSTSFYPLPLSHVALIDLPIMPMLLPNLVLLTWPNPNPTFTLTLPSYCHIPIDLPFSTSIMLTFYLLFVALLDSSLHSCLYLPC